MLCCAAFACLFVLVPMAVVGIGCGDGGGERQFDLILSTTTVSDRAISLSWSGNLLGEETFEVYKDESAYITTPNNTTTVSGLSPETRYCFRVLRVDAAGGVTGETNRSCSTTFAEEDGAGRAVSARSVSLSPGTVSDGLSRSAKSYVPDEWTIRAVDSVGRGGAWTAIALDSVDRVHILYNEHSGDGSRLQLAIHLGGAWSRQVIDGGTEANSGMAMSIDDGGDLHIVYSDAASSQLMYAGRDSATWTKETVGDLVGASPSVKADWAGNVHISCLDPLKGALMYATNGGGDWRVHPVDRTGMSGDGADTSIALDSQSRVHIAYYDCTLETFPQETGVLKYATNTRGAWETMVVERSPAIGGFPSIASDSTGDVHIAFFDSAGLAVKYATNSLGMWVVRVIERTSNEIRSTSIAVDLADRVHIAYIDGSQHALKYATNASGEWEISTVDTEAHALGRASVAVDSRGKAHISYAGAAGLKYATNR